MQLQITKARPRHGSMAMEQLSCDRRKGKAPSLLLRRTANGQPAMIMYDHGLGKVIVSSMDSDFALSHNQASQEELALVRDMIACAV
jgi:hypothetical protein